jgi:hypothetical protein
MAHKKQDVSYLSDYQKWREYWKNQGPVEFALKQLKIDPNMGGPLLLSDGQHIFLDDVATGKFRLIIIAAGRGSGKTFVLAIYIMWRIFTHDNWHIACMGGSSEQSEKIISYIRGWIINNPTLAQYTLRNIQKEVGTYSNSSASFHACSGTSVRGPHTTELIIDEQAAGEEKGGGKFIQAALYDVSTSPDIRVIQSSTAQYIHGDFLKTWQNAEKLGYKKYTWSIAKHINGNPDPYSSYKDKDPTHWVTNIPWIPTINIQILRKKSSDDEWLVEALGGISMSSGLVLNPEDFKSCLCDGRGVCPAIADDGTCQPYIEKKCPIIQYVVNVYYGMSQVPVSTAKCLQQFVHERVMGIDWGRGSPCAFVVLGKFKEMVFVLEAVEFTGLTDTEKINYADELAKKWNIEIIRPDPREWTLNGMLADKGYAVHELFSFEGGNEKYEYVGTLKKYIERHQVIIPNIFEDLIRSMRMLAYDEKGKIRKIDDHSSDAMMYAISFYGEIDSESALWELLPNEQRGLKSFW